MLKRISNNEQTQIKKFLTGIIAIVTLFYLVSCSLTEDTLPLSEATPPSAVENLNVDSYTDSEVTLSWTAPTNTGTTNGITAATLSGYVVKYKQTGANNFIKIDEKSVGVRLTGALTGTSTTATVIGLSEGTSYTFLVVAVNSANAVGLDKDALRVIQTTLKPTPPSAVESLKVDSFTDSEVALSWTAPTNTGTTDGITAATLSGYVVKYKRTADSEFTEIDKNSVGVRLTGALTGTSTTATVTGLDANTSYTFLVVAVNSANAVGLDKDAPTIERTTLLREATPPSAVENLKVDSSTDNQVVISWTTPTNTGTTDGTTTATLSGYVVKYKQTGANNFIKIDEKSVGVRLTGALTGTSTTATVIGLDANTPYTFIVVAVHSADVVGLDEDALTVEQTTAPAPPVNLSKINTCDKTTSVDLAWDTSSGATSYKVYRDDTRGNTNIITNNTTSYTDTGLDPATSYTYKVQSCSTAGCSGDSDSLTITTISDKSFESIIEIGRTPTGLTNYDQRSQEIFSHYKSDVLIEAKYLKPGGSGSGDGSSFADAEGNLKDVLDGITDAAADKVYAVFLAGGNYQAGSAMAMKNHVAIIGGVGECLDSSDTVTTLDGQDSDRVFFNSSGIDSTALLYGVTVTKGRAKNSPEDVYGNRGLQGIGGGMYNTASSPSLVKVTFSENTADYGGGGIFNGETSSPILVGVTFSGNTAADGGGMYNSAASPILVGVTFFSNTAKTNGGGMFNDNDTIKGYPLIINGIFWGNTAGISGDEFYFSNEPGSSDNHFKQENLGIYNSIVQGGTGTLVSGEANTNLNQGGFAASGAPVPVVISFADIIATNPGLGSLANNGGSVLTHAIPSTSPAVNQGLYVRKSETNFYYSKDSTTWYTEPDLSEVSVLPTDAVDILATDATGYPRSGRPDLGAYEAR